MTDVVYNGAFGFIGKSSSTVRERMPTKVSGEGFLQAQATSARPITQGSPTDRKPPAFQWAGAFKDSPMWDEVMEEIERQRDLHWVGGEE